MSKPLQYPPPFQDTVTLAAHLSISTSTVENWVQQGHLPPPVRCGGKLMWEWSEVCDWIRNKRDNAVPTDARSMRDAVKRERQASH
jgi:predicted DNA-binding transcriptional regulator AlpA